MRFGTMETEAYFFVSLYEFDKIIHYINLTEKNKNELNKHPSY